MAKLYGIFDGKGKQVADIMVSNQTTLESVEKMAQGIHGDVRVQERQIEPLERNSVRNRGI